MFPLSSPTNIPRSARSGKILRLIAMWLILAMKQAL